MDATLDPDDWPAFRAQSHRMLDDMLDYLQTIRQRPVWQPIADEVRGKFQQPLPRTGEALATTHQRFLNDIVPHAVGNAHPVFMGWVHGGGTPVGMLAELLAAGLNANCGGRDQIPLDVERQVTRWMRELFGFPETAGGLFVTGTSMANWLGILIASRAALGADVRHGGLAGPGAGLVAYASRAAHGSIAQAMDLSGLGTAALRLIDCDERHRIDLSALAAAIAADRAAGRRPFCVIGAAGTVDIGAIDDLSGLADIARRERLWFHIDGAFAALGMLTPAVAPLLSGIERADSLAFDFHKWGQVPYDAGFLLVRDQASQLATFASPAAYLRRESRGLAGGSPWPCDLGPDLSRGFKALKTWFTFQVYGAERLGQAIANTCRLAADLAARIEADPRLELLAPVTLNIVCFRFVCTDADRINAAIVADLQEAGIAAPSTTTIDGRLAIRAAIVNHRTQPQDLATLIDGVIARGHALTQSTSTPERP